MTHERTGTPYFGKFRATVVDNIDPMQLGRVKVTVPDVPAPGLAGGVLLTAPGGASISVSDAGILITNGRGASISMTGPTTDINAGALAVT